MESKALNRRIPKELINKELVSHFECMASEKLHDNNNYISYYSGHKVLDKKRKTVDVDTILYILENVVKQQEFYQKLYSEVLKLNYDDSSYMDSFIKLSFQAHKTKNDIKRIQYAINHKHNIANFTINKNGKLMTNFYNIGARLASDTIITHPLLLELMHKKGII